MLLMQRHTQTTRRQVEVSGRNYVLENTKDLLTRRPAVREETSALLKEIYGLVPNYLLQYKLDRAASVATQQVDAACMPT